MIAQTSPESHPNRREARPALVRQYDRPQSTAQEWRVPSATEDRDWPLEAVTDLDGTRIHCGCPAGVHRRPCRHAALVRQAIEGTLEYEDRRRAPAAHPSVAQLFGRPERSA